MDQSKKRVPGWSRWAMAALILASAASVLVSRAVTHSAGNATISVNPPYQARLYYQPTPVVVSVGIANVNNLAAFQFSVRWDPTVLQYQFSGADAGQPQAGATVVGSTGRSPLCSYTTYRPPDTPTPGGPTVTPTYTDTPIPPTDTPVPTGSPTPTFTVTSTPTATPTVYDYLKYSCASLGQALNPGSPAGPNIGLTPAALLNVTLKPIAPNQVSSAIRVGEVSVLDPFATPIAAVGQNGVVALAGCHDMNGDLMITIADLGIVASHYGATPANPLPAGWTWLQTPPFYGQGVLYDVNGNNLIDIGDLAQIAAAFGQHC
ncbi:MAG TPA: hypothetical protein VEZ14_01990 [Dehalococcoidia bacterium]|nr:hypothetical protein [Dehalococcoidia bacterium]